MLEIFRKFQTKPLHAFLCKTLVTTADMKLAKSHGDLSKTEKLYNQMLLQTKHQSKRNGIDKYTSNCMISVYGRQKET